MSQQFSIALIIEFVEIDNREVKENIFFEVMPRSLECCYLQTFYSGTTATGNMQNLTI